MSKARLNSSNVGLGITPLNPYPTEVKMVPERLSSPDDAPRPRGVLIVEDNCLLRKSLGQGFRNRGFDLWSAANGAEGVDLYRQFWPLIDVVLSDVQMPVLSGADLLDALRKINPSVRFCFMTGDTRITTCLQLLRPGVLRIFEKPLPSVAGVAEELWELAVRPNQALDSPQIADLGASPLDRPERPVLVHKKAQDQQVLAWICKSLRTSISRINWVVGRRSS